VDIAYTMADPDKPEWQDELREHPVLLLPFGIALAAGAVGCWAQYAGAMKTLAEDHATYITVAALAVVVVMMLTAWILMHFRLLERMARWRERRGFEVKRKDDDES
jgi:hypothetical protein